MKNWFDEEQDAGREKIVLLSKLEGRNESPMDISISTYSNLHVLQLGIKYAEVILQM